MLLPLEAAAVGAGLALCFAAGVGADGFFGAAAGVALPAAAAAAAVGALPLAAAAATEEGACRLNGVEWKCSGVKSDEQTDWTWKKKNGVDKGGRRCRWKSIENPSPSCHRSFSLSPASLRPFLMPLSIILSSIPHLDASGQGRVVVVAAAAALHRLFLLARRRRFRRCGLGRCSGLGLGGGRRRRRSRRSRQQRDIVRVRVGHRDRERERERSAACFFFSLLFCSEIEQRASIDDTRTSTVIFVLSLGPDLLFPFFFSQVSFISFLRLQIRFNTNSSAASC